MAGGWAIKLHLMAGAVVNNNAVGGASPRRADGVVEDNVDNLLSSSGHGVSFSLAVVGLLWALSVPIAAHYARRWTA